jgi:hypothetical protein
LYHPPQFAELSKISREIRTYGDQATGFELSSETWIRSVMTDIFMASARKFMVIPSSADDLFVRIDSFDHESVRAAWSSVLPKQSLITAASLFGDLFISRESGEILMLEVTSGEVKQVAVCVEEFEWDLDQREKQEQWLLRGLALAARAAGLIPGSGECLAFRTPPMLGGKLHPANLLPWSFVKYHEGLAQLFPQLRGLPRGTQIVPKANNPDF